MYNPHDELDCYCSRLKQTAHKSSLVYKRINETRDRNKTREKGKTRQAIPRGCLRLW